MQGFCSLLSASVCSNTRECTSTDLPQRGRHGEEAEDEVRDGQGGDEGVPRGAHVGVRQHGPDDEHVAQEAHDDEQQVREEEEPAHSGQKQLI